MTESYNYLNNIWDYILPDGSGFCHWGGKAASYQILKILDLNDSERICDLCCGEAGTLSLIDKEKLEIYGVDISDSISRKSKSDFNLVQADVKKMPFASRFFDKLFAQDPDVFLHPKKAETLREISRILKKRGIFVCQTYCATSNISEEEKRKTSNLLSSLGYPYTDVIGTEDIPDLFSSEGFQIEFIKEMHEIYLRDNIKMIENLEKNWLKIKDKKIRRLLYWEKYLFSKSAWTGILIFARKS